MRLGRDYFQSNLCRTLDLPTSEWIWALREFKESGQVVQVGERRQYGHSWA